MGRTSFHFECRSRSSLGVWEAVLKRMTCTVYLMSYLSYLFGGGGEVEGGVRRLASARASRYVELCEKKKCTHEDSRQEQT